MLNAFRTILAVVSLLCATGCALIPGYREFGVVTCEAGPMSGEFRPYFAKLTRSVESHWVREAAGIDEMPPPGSKVVIKVRLTADGLVGRIDEVDPVESKQATYACLDAVTLAQPYRRWSKDMVSTFGGEHEVTFEFVYK